MKTQVTGKPICDRVIVEVVKPAMVSPGGLVLTGQPMSYRVARVLEVGPGWRLATPVVSVTDVLYYQPIPVQSGDIVAIPESGGIPLAGPGERREDATLMLRMDEVLMVLSEESVKALNIGAEYHAGELVG